MVNMLGTLGILHRHTHPAHTAFLLYPACSGPVFDEVIIETLLLCDEVNLLSTTTGMPFSGRITLLLFYAQARSLLTFLHLPKETFHTLPPAFDVKRLSFSTVSMRNAKCEMHAGYDDLQASCVVRESAARQTSAAPKAQ
jgi:hypothetical protein